MTVSTRRSRRPQPMQRVVPAYTRGIGFLAFASLPTLLIALGLSAPAQAQSVGEDNAAAPAAPAAPASTDGEIAAPAAPAASDDGAAAAAPAAPADESAAAAAPAEAAAVPASAPTQKLQNVQVTGSAIASPDAATTVPVSVMHMEDLRREGVSSVDQLMQRISANNGGFGTSAGTTGQNTNGVSWADMRGLGSQYTLVLLNGRRLPIDPAYATAPDLNSIPFDALDRVEVLRDGASALYGSDAIGGVINFITKKNYQGLSVNTHQSTPTHGGGGQDQNYSFTWGTGDLDKDGYNIFGTMGYEKQRGISTDRRGFVRPYDPDQGITSGASVFNYPATIGDTAMSGPGNLGRHQLLTPNGYRYNTSHNQWLVAPTEKTNLYTEGTFKMGEHTTGALSLFWARSRVQTRGGPTDIMPYNGYPTYDGPHSEYAGQTMYLRGVPLGNRVTNNTNDSKRIMFEVKGDHAAGWRYDTAAYYNVSSLHEDLSHGYANAFDVMNDINSGVIDPLSAEVTPEEQAAWNRDEIRGRLMTGKYQSYNWDGNASHDIGDWFGAGPAQIAIGAEAAHEKLSTDTSDLAGEDFSTGYSAGQGAHASRNHGAVWAEMNVPVLDSLSFTVSDRFNKYAHYASKTTPKVSFRYQPIDQVVFRGSYSKGFRVPSLMEADGADYVSNTNSGLYDPNYCTGPGGGLPSNCDIQFNALGGGNRNLQPESSKNWTLGMVAEPIPHLTTNVDLWWVHIDRQIGYDQDYQDIILNHPELVERYPEGSPNAGHISGLNTHYQNLGSVNTNGVDVGLNYKLPTSIGTWGLGFEGTYTNKYTRSRYGQTESQMGYNSDGTEINYRWVHTVNLDWAKDGWHAEVLNHYRTGLRDADPSTHKRVASYTTWDGNLGYAFVHGPSITLGMTNIFNRKPPFTNQQGLFTQGYMPQYYDLIGRTVYTSLSWNF